MDRDEPYGLDDETQMTWGWDHKGNPVILNRDANETNNNNTETKEAR